MDPTTRPFRFGVIARSVTGRIPWQELARRVEDFGYDTLVMPEHLGGIAAPFSSLIVAANATHSLRVGTFTLNGGIWNPVLLAREAATARLLTDGRFELGIGAGWQKHDVTGIGDVFLGPADRVTALEESVQIVQRLLDRETVSFSGRFRRAEAVSLGLEVGSKGTPERIPLLIGGAGRRLLSYAARTAEIVGLSTRGLPAGGLDLANATAAATAQKVAWIREAAGKRWPSLELNLLASTVEITDRSTEAVSALASQLGVEPAALARMPNRLIGSPSQIEDRLLRQRAELGISYLVVPVAAAEAFAPLAARLRATDGVRAAD